MQNMALNEKPKPIDAESYSKGTNDEQNDYRGIDTSVVPQGDEVYERKVAVMNQALIDIGMGSFQWKIFAMTGFGWFVDNVSTLYPQFALIDHQLK